MSYPLLGLVGKILLILGLIIYWLSRSKLNDDDRRKIELKENQFIRSKYNNWWVAVIVVISAAVAFYTVAFHTGTFYAKIVVIFGFVLVAYYSFKELRWVISSKLGNNPTKLIFLSVLFNAVGIVLLLVAIWNFNISVA